MSHSITAFQRRIPIQRFSKGASPHVHQEFGVPDYECSPEPAQIHHMQRRCFSAIVGFCSFLLIACSTCESADGDRLFTLKVLPLLKEKCFGCHGNDPADIRGELDLLTREKMLEGGESEEPSIVPGKPEESLLYQAILWDGYEMPPRKMIDSPRMKQRTFANGFWQERPGRTPRHRKRSNDRNGPFVKTRKGSLSTPAAACRMTGPIGDMTKTTSGHFSRSSKLTRASLKSPERTSLTR